MTYIFTTEDPIEAQRLMKAEEMVIALSKIISTKHSYKYREDLTLSQRKLLEEINDRIVHICRDINIEEMLE